MKEKNVLKLIAKIKRRKKIPRIGDYVFASKWEDASPNDGWYVGFVKEIKYERYYIQDSGLIGYRAARVISAEEGELILKKYPEYEKYRAASAESQPAIIQQAAIQNGKGK